MTDSLTCNLVRGKRCLGVVFTLGVAATPFSQAEEVVYRETFPNPTGQAQSLVQYAWTYHLGPAGWDETRNDATRSLVNESRGSQPDAAPVASGDDATSPNGYVVNALGPDGLDDDPWWNRLSLYVTEEVAIDQSTHALTAMSVDLAVSQPDAARFVVRVGDRWLASAEAFEPTPLAGYAVYDRFAADHAECRLEFDAAEWLPLAFVPGTTMSLDLDATPIALPDGPLTAVGLLIQPTGFEAFDNFTIYGVSNTPSP
ncbi:MAG: hypothetical protein AAGI54_15205 [Planctomycetota bacterium]